jgi:hypothetical protein
MVIALGYIQDCVGSPLMDPLKYINHDVSYIPGYPYTMRDVVSPPRRYIFIGLLPVLCLTSNKIYLLLELIVLKECNYYSKTKFPLSQVTPADYPV